MFSLKTGIDHPSILIGETALLCRSRGGISVVQFAAGRRRRILRPGRRMTDVKHPPFGRPVFAAAPVPVYGVNSGVPEDQ